MKGARCRYNEHHHSSFMCSKRINERLGTIIREKKDKSCWCIEWDGAKGTKYVSKSFIEIINEKINIEQIANSLTEINNFYVTHTKTTNNSYLPGITS